MENIKGKIENIVNWIKNSVKEANCKGVVFGLSGGIDSAVIASLAKKAFPNDSLGIIMPCESDPEDEKDGMLVAKEVDIRVKKVDLDNTYQTFLMSTDEDIDRESASNIKPRLRMTTLYYFGQKYKYLVLGSTNKSEYHIGYFTKHGDSGVDLLPLADLLKYEIFELAKYLNINRKIIEKKPSAGLCENQSDEDDMGFSYEVLDRYVEYGNIEDEFVKKRIENMNENSKHKRSYPPIF